MKKLLLLVLLTLTWVTGAYGNEKVHNTHHHRHHRGHSVSHRHFNDGRPMAWCGWQMRQWFGGDAKYNMAEEWAHRGTPAQPREFNTGVVVVVWPHHVGYITGYDNKRHEYIIKSGNSGPHRTVYEHARSIAGAIAIRKLPDTDVLQSGNGYIERMWLNNEH